MTILPKDIPDVIQRLIAQGSIKLPDPATQVANFAAKMVALERSRARADERRERKRMEAPKTPEQCRYCGTKSNKHSKNCQRQ